MTILITGIAGYIGSHVALAFSDAGYEVVGIDNFTTGFKQLVPEKVEFYEGDFSDQNLQIGRASCRERVFPVV